MVSRLPLSPPTRCVSCRKVLLQQWLYYSKLNLIDLRLTKRAGIGVISPAFPQVTTTITTVLGGSVETLTATIQPGSTLAPSTVVNTVTHFVTVTTTKPNGYVTILTGSEVSTSIRTFTTRTGSGGALVTTSSAFPVVVFPGDGPDSSSTTTLPAQPIVIRS